VSCSYRADSPGHSLVCFVLAPQAADFPVNFSQLSIEFRNFRFLRLERRIRAAALLEATTAATALEQKARRLNLLADNSKPSIGDESKSFSDIGDIANAIGLTTNAKYVRDLIDKPVSPDSVIRVLEAALTIDRIAGVTRADDKDPRSTRPATTDEIIKGEVSSRAIHATELLRSYGVSGYHALAYQSLLSGDVALPTIEQLVTSRAHLPACKKELGSRKERRVVTASKSPETLCMYLGLETYQQLLDDAYVVLIASPTIRNNLLLLQMVRAKSIAGWPLANRYALATQRRWPLAYRYALASDRPGALNALFPHLELFRIKEDQRWLVHHFIPVP
jgi:hypothetical protein